MKNHAYYNARNKVLTVVTFGKSPIPTLIQIRMEGNKVAREYCVDNGYEMKF